VQAFDWVKRLTWLRVALLVGLFGLSLMVMFAHGFEAFLYFRF